MHKPMPRQNSEVKLPASFVILMLFCFCGLLAGYVFYEMTPTIYQSNASFQVGPAGLKLPVENFDYEFLLNDEHEKRIVSHSVIGLALRESQLENLDSFKKLYSQGGIEKENAIEQKERVFEYVISNLVVEQIENDPLVSRPGTLNYEITYSETDAQDAQTVLNGILDAYETRLGEWFLSYTYKSISSLLELYEIAEASLAQEKAKNASEGVVVRLEERLAEIVTQIQALEFYTKSVTQPRLLDFKVLSKPTFGEPASSILHISPIIGLLVGLLLWALFFVLLKLTKAFSISNKTAGTSSFTPASDDNSDVDVDYEIAGSADSDR